MPTPPKPAPASRDRRHPDRQRPQLHGRRATDPTLTTRDIADRLGVSTGFIVGEIRDGRLAALQLRRTGKRTVYRVSEADFDAYVARHWMPASDRPSA